MTWPGRHHTACAAWFTDAYQWVNCLSVTPTQPGVWVLSLPNGEAVEVFAEGHRGKELVDIEPVAGFVVEDLPGAVSELRAAGIELLGDPGRPGNNSEHLTATSINSQPPHLIRGEEMAPHDWHQPDTATAVLRHLQPPLHRPRRGPSASRRGRASRR
ncbi:hypothetical protein [Brachybacterium sacelli]|uniref:hypothetical protein n=1 Tax=Brachybacterium sacelli TaxID=173364 RepID=UPI00337A2F98